MTTTTTATADPTPTIQVRIDRSGDWGEVLVNSEVVIRCHEDEIFERMVDTGLLPNVQVDWNAIVIGKRV